MTTSAIIMLCFGLLVTWGGAAVCLSIAIIRQRQNKTKE